MRGFSQNIISAGGFAETAVVDAFDERAVAAHFDSLARNNARIGILFNAIGSVHEMLAERGRNATLLGRLPRLSEVAEPPRLPRRIAAAR